MADALSTMQDEETLKSEEQLAKTEKLLTTFNVLDSGDIGHKYLSGIQSNI